MVKLQRLIRGFARAKEARLAALRLAWARHGRRLARGKERKERRRLEALAAELKEAQSTWHRPAAGAGGADAAASDDAFARENKLLQTLNVNIGVCLAQGSSLAARARDDLDAAATKLRKSRAANAHDREAELLERQVAAAVEAGDGTLRGLEDGHVEALVARHLERARRAHMATAFARAHTCAARGRPAWFSPAPAGEAEAPPRARAGDRDRERESAPAGGTRPRPSRRRATRTCSYRAASARSRSSPRA